MVTDVPNELCRVRVRKVAFHGKFGILAGHKRRPIWLAAKPKISEAAHIM